MSRDLLTVVSGIATGADEFIISLDNFVVGVLGWERAAVIADTGSEKHYAYRSTGEVEGQFPTLYVTFRGTSTIIYSRACSFVEPGGTTHDEVYDGSETRITMGSTIEYWIYGNKDCIYFTDVSTTSPATAGAGYLITPYTQSQDPYPAFAMGQASTSDRFPNISRVFSYSRSRLEKNLTDGMYGGPYLSPSSTISGAALGLDGLSFDFLEGASPHQRDGRYYCSPVTLYYPRNSSFLYSGIRGSLPNIWNIWATGFSPGQEVTGSGINFYTGTQYEDSKFIIFPETSTDDNTIIAGPIVHFDATDEALPYSIGNCTLYLKADKGIDRRGGAFHGGRVKAWRDCSLHPINELGYDGNRNDAAQVTDSNQPTPVDSVVNSLPVVRFDSSSSQYMNDSLTVNNDMTIFTVASYSDGSSIAPIISIRGNVSAVDTEFSIKFNEDSNNSVSVINRAGGGLDKNVITGLSSGTMYVITNTVSGTDTLMYLDGGGSPSVSSNTKGSVGASSSINYSLGVSLQSGGTTDSDYGDLDIAEVIVFNKYLTEEERQSILCSLGNKYGISVAGC